MNVARSGHSCAKMVLKDKVYLVVAGGYDEYRWMGALDSVELLDPTSNKGWILGDFFNISFLKFHHMCD